jgi:hypothetical protein
MTAPWPILRLAAAAGLLGALGGCGGGGGVAYDGGPHAYGYGYGYGAYDCAGYAPGGCGDVRYRVRHRVDRYVKTVPRLRSVVTPYVEEVPVRRPSYYYRGCGGGGW